MNNNEKASAILQESVMNVKTIQSCNGQNTMVNKFRTILDFGRIFGIMQYFWNGFFDGIFFFILYLFNGFGI